MRHLAVFALVVTLAACAPPPPAAPPAPTVQGCAGLRGEPGITARLYFGRTMEGGQPITEAAWQAFLAEKVTPRFPSGFTIIQTSGQWRQRSTGRIVQQPSTVIEVAAPRDADTIWKFEEIRADFRQAFNHESVGLVVTENCFSF